MCDSDHADSNDDRNETSSLLPAARKHTKYISQCNNRRGRSRRWVKLSDDASIVGVEALAPLPHCVDWWVSFPPFVVMPRECARRAGEAGRRGMRRRLGWPRAAPTAARGANRTRLVASTRAWDRYAHLSIDRSVAVQYCDGLVWKRGWLETWQDTPLATGGAVQVPPLKRLHQRACCTRP